MQGGEPGESAEVHRVPEVVPRFFRVELVQFCLLSARPRAELVAVLHTHEVGFQSHCGRVQTDVPHDECTSDRGAAHLVSTANATNKTIPH